MSTSPETVEAVPEVVVALHAGDPIERDTAVERAIQRGAAALPPVIEGLRHGNGLVRWNAAYTLGRMGPAAAEAVPPLIGALHDHDPEIRTAAALALGEIGPASGEVVTALAGALRDEDSLPRSAATAALGRIGPGAAAAVPALVVALHDSSVGVADGAAEALARIGPPAVPALTAALPGDDWATRERAARALGAMGAGAVDAIPALVESLRTNSDEVRHALVRIGAAAIPPLIEALRDDDPTVRLNAANTLGDFGPAARDAIPALTALLSTGSTSFALGRIGPLAAPSLIAALKDPDPTVRADAVGALARMKPPATTALPGLIAALRDPNENVRAVATRAVGHTAPPDVAVRWLIEALHDDSTLVRHWAADILARIGPPARAAVPILEAMQANEPNTASYAALALHAIVAEPPTSPTPTRPPIDLRYRVVVGEFAAPATSGNVWLYAVRPSSVTRRELASIVDSRAHIELTPESLARGWSGEEYDREEEPQAYIVAIELAGNQWQRTADLNPKALWNELPQFLNDLGAATPLGAETLLRLPSPARRRIVFADPNGRPAADLMVPISIDFAVLGRCQLHEGVALGTFRTDASGALTFRAPSLPLYLDIAYFETTETGRLCREDHGIEIGPAAAAALQQMWQLDAPERDFVLTVRTADGAPMAGAAVVHTLCIVNCCGANWGTVATTDEAGVAQLRLVPETTASLRLEKAGEERELSEDELTQLFAAGRLTLTW